MLATSLLDSNGPTNMGYWTSWVVTWMIYIYIIVIICIYIHKYVQKMTWTAHVHNSILSLASVSRWFQTWHHCHTSLRHHQGPPRTSFDPNHAGIWGLARSARLEVDFPVQLIDVSVACLKCWLWYNDLGEYLLMFSRRCFNFSCWWWWFQCILSYLVTNWMKNERSMSPLNFLLVDHHLASPNGQGRGMWRACWKASWRRGRYELYEFAPPESEFIRYVMVVLPMLVEYYYVLLLTGDIMGVKQTILSISLVDTLFHGGFTIMSRGFHGHHFLITSTDLWRYVQPHAWIDATRRSLPQARNHLGVACSDHGKSHFEGSLLSDLISTLMFHLAGNAGKRWDIYNLSQVTTIQIQWRRGVHQKLWVPHWLQWNIIFENDSSIAILSALSYPLGPRFARLITHGTLCRRRASEGPRR